MSQRNIKNYFSVNSNNPAVISESDSESDEDTNINKYVVANADIKYYEDLFKRKADLKNMAKVVINESGISECWKHFGDLHLKNRHILQNYKFCKLCMEESIVKA